MVSTTGEPYRRKQFQIVHIPDGYLSPSTCGSLYLAATPFWYAALRLVKRTFSAQMVPLVSVFAAFCFVVMLFNLPLPGGTTGHAVGMGIAAIVLGPWVSMLALSAALLIQALFFGDGGITTFGANCFNMAIIGSLIAAAVYRLVAGTAPIASARRVVAAGVAGYLAINAAALCAAIEFGIQPALFHDHSGVPLYAPYPLSISIPAMMIGHLTFAGLAELVISAGVVAYLQRVNPALLRATAPESASLEAPADLSHAARFRPTLRKLWLALALLLIFTPLGILAVGSAWGEWSARDFSDPAVRHEMATASHNQLPPERTPAGLARLSSLWKAPLANYTAPFVRKRYLGYFASAAFGVAATILFALLVSWLLSGRPISSDSKSRHSRSFVEKTLARLIRAAQETRIAEEIAQSNDFLQRLDPRVNLAGIGVLIAGTILVHRIWALIALFVVGVMIALLSHVSLGLLAKRIWIAVLAFTGLIALPAVFLVPGVAVFRLPLLEWPVSREGLYAAAFLVLRAETAATFGLLLVLCTPWNHLLKGLRFFRIPAIAVVVLGMTYRYVFLFLRTAQDMIESRQSRIIGRFEPAEQRRLAGASAGVLLDKSLVLSGDVYSAMQARGFRGDMRLLDDFQMKGRDWLQLTAFVIIAFILVWFGR